MARPSRRNIAANIKNTRKDSPDNVMVHDSDPGTLGRLGTRLLDGFENAHHCKQRNVVRHGDALCSTQ